jgi:hypothetical protein
MIARYAILGLLVAAPFVAPPTQAIAAKATLSRQEIKAMPILQRPSRPGHFYGNTVRRHNGR